MDYDVDLIMRALSIARANYSNNGLKHALRVAEYVYKNNMIDNNIKTLCVALAIMHDLIEDTNVEIMDIIAYFDNHIAECLDLLTKDKNEDYNKYLMDIKECSKLCPEVYWVKIADIKDHLNLKNTLTNRLKEKYLNGLAILL